MKRNVLYLLFAICISLTGYSQKKSTVTRIYYRSGYRILDTLYRDNYIVLQRFVHLIDNARRANELDSIEVRSYASPDGSILMNRRLATLRADSLVAYLMRRTKLPETMFKVHANGIGWELLREAVAQSDMQYRDEVLQIMDNTPEWIHDEKGHIIDGMKKRLMDLRGGQPYFYMKKHFFPDMRSCSAVSLYLKEGAKTLKDELAKGLDVKESRRKVQNVTKTEREADTERIDTESTVQKKTAAAETAAHDAKPTMPAIAETEEQQANPLQRLAIKTNLLYDALLMPSVEVEYRINDRWSVNLEGEIAWWKKKPKHKYYQLAMISPEGRYWFKTKSLWHGHYVGAFVGGGWYDLENGKRGYQGEGVMAGVSYGYMFPVTRSLSFEAGIGAGYLRAKYEEYLPEAGGHYLYQQTSKTNYFGPLKLKFALVWRLGDFISKKGGMQ